MREIERSAPSVEEAVEAALEELGVSEQEAQVEVVQEPRSGFLGLKAQAAIVKVRVPEVGDEAVAEDLEEQGEVAADFLEGLLETMGLPADVEINEVDAVTYVDLWGVESEDDMALLIGRHGQTLDGLQELVRLAVQQKTGERCRVMVDVEDYRKRRRSQIAQRAQDVARRVKKSGKPEALDPMTSYERKVVHDTVALVGGLETLSEGEEPNRRVVIRPKA
jgi:spoIIIJ-associated protein